MPSMLIEDEEGQVLPSIKDFALDAKEKLPKGGILQNNIAMKSRGQEDIWKVGLKVQLYTKEKHNTKEKINELFPIFSNILKGPYLKASIFFLGIYKSEEI